MTILRGNDMEKQVKFSMEEVSQIVGHYVFDNGLLGDVKNIEIVFHQGNKPDDSYITVKEA
jgi:hypothetical protein